ncbi:MAG: acyl--CoA ligase [Bacteroidia bacterium]|nr:acyl--CoA ligase [Bacteroidia bacterium]
MEKGLSIRRHPLLNSYLEKWSQDSSGKIALIQAEQGRQWMYRQLMQQVDHFTGHLWKSGLRPGDRLASFLGNKMENVALMWACWKIGIAFAPLQNRHIAKNAQQLLDTIQPSMAVISAQTAKILHDQRVLFDVSPIQWREFHQNKKGIIGLSGLDYLGPYKFSYREAIFKKKKPWQDLGNEIHSWRPALILYPYTQSDHFDPMLICFEHIAAQIHALADLTNLDKRIKTLVVPPLETPESIILSMILPIMLGGSAVLTDADSTLEWQSLVSRYHVNTLFPRSIEVENILEEKNLRPEWSSLSKIFYPYPKADAASRSSLFCKKIGGIVFKETGGYMALQHPRYSELFIPLSRISIRESLHESGKDGRELQAGEIGEICIHPPMVHGGLLQKNGVISPKVSREGIFYTGLRGSLYNMDDKIFLKIEEEAAVPMNMRWNPAA